MEDVLSTILVSPIFSKLKPSVELFGDLKAVPNTDDLNQILCIDDICFVPQGGKPRSFSEHYEPRIFLKREVQTRNQSLHDFFNALVWHMMPKTKCAINQLHYQLQKSRYPAMGRAPAENMLTIFDEHGAVIVSHNAHLLQLIKQRRWHELFWLRREEVRNELSITIFGHGLYEKALKPYVGLTTHCLLFHVPSACSVDELASAFLLERTSSLQTSDLHPLPMLGMPGWWSDNEREEFYANIDYFRPLRASRAC